MANPLAAILTQVRHAVIDPTAYSAADAIGGTGRLLLPGAVMIGACLLGLWVFNREAPKIAERL
jgi:ABC-2 type transport system permease protein